MKNSRIVQDPKIMGGKPVIKGTRVPVEILVRKVAEGASTQDLLDAYPRITKEDIQAALLFAADVLALEEISFQE